MRVTEEPLTINSTVLDSFYAVLVHIRAATVNCNTFEHRAVSGDSNFETPPPV